MANIPLGLCQCSCGGKTRLARKTSSARGHIKGVAVRYIAGHQRRSLLPEYAIEDHGYVTPCWIWQRSLSGGRYAQAWDGSSPQLGHILYYERKYGAVPHGHELDHLCHNRNLCPGGKLCIHRRCVNPDHMEPVTSAVNIQRGSMSKLDPAKILAIRSLILEGHTFRAVAEKFSISSSRISEIANGRSWANVPRRV